jgi:hypothetical protein
MHLEGAAHPAGGVAVALQGKKEDWGFGSEDGGRAAHTILEECWPGGCELIDSGLKSKMNVPRDLEPRYAWCPWQDIIRHEKSVIPMKSITSGD